MVGVELLLACALNVAPATTLAIIQVESGGNVYAVHVNGDSRKFEPGSLDEAVRIAREAMFNGRSVDLGLMQVNNRNLASLGYQLEDMFEPCANIRAGSAILAAEYASATTVYGPGQRALSAALSAYNTGNFERGFRNGYVAQFYTLPSVAKPKAGTVEGVGDPYTADTVIFRKHNP